MSSSLVVLEDDRTRAEIVPDQGARVRSLTDRGTGRELLYRRPVERWDPQDYLATMAGGWDQMFPNDDPWRGFPVHGVLWAARFRVESLSARAAVLGCTLAEPAVRVEHLYELLDAPRRGLRLTTTMQAAAEVAPFLWATHPMLAVEAGWVIDVGDVTLDADDTDPGRVAAGRLSPEARSTVSTLPAGGQGWQEVLYAPASGAASVTSADRKAGTRVTWDAGYFRHLWIVTLSGFASVDLALVLEPCTTRPYRLDEGIEAGTAVMLAPGETRTVWSEVESLDEDSAPSA